MGFASLNPSYELPMSLAPVPGVEQVGEAIVDQAGERSDHGIAEERCEPALPRRHPPDFDRDIGADDQAAGFVGGMEPAADVLERGPMGGERFRCEIDVAELDRAGLDRSDELVALAIDAGIANRAAGVVPDDEMPCGHGRTAGVSTFMSRARHIRNSSRSTYSGAPKG